MLSSKMDFSSCDIMLGFVKSSHKCDDLSGELRIDLVLQININSNWQ